MRGVLGLAGGRKRGADTKRGTRARWRGLCERQAVLAHCAKSVAKGEAGGESWWIKEGGDVREWGLGGGRRGEQVANVQVCEACSWLAAWGWLAWCWGLCQQTLEAWRMHASRARAGGALVRRGARRRGTPASWRDANRARGHGNGKTT